MQRHQAGKRSRLTSWEGLIHYRLVVVGERQSLFSSGDPCFHPPTPLQRKHKPQLPRNILKGCKVKVHTTVDIPQIFDVDRARRELRTLVFQDAPCHFGKNVLSDSNFECVQGGFRRMWKLQANGRWDWKPAMASWNMCVYVHTSISTQTTRGTSYTSLGSSIIPNFIIDTHPAQKNQVLAEWSRSKIQSWVAEAGSRCRLKLIDRT